MPTDINTVAALQAATIPSGASVIQLLGYYAVADGAGHLRRRGSNVPSAIQSADGTYWEYLSENNRYDIRHFGARVDGSTDDTAAINLAIGALPKIPGSYSTASAPRLYFPAGRTITQGGHAIPSDKKCRVVGDGSYTSVIQIVNGYAGSNDMLTIGSMNSSVENLMIEGNRASVTGTQDGLVINAAQVHVLNLRIASLRGSGLVIGKAASGINVHVAFVDIRFCLRYGVNIVSGGSTDGAWANVSAGANGYSGFNVATGTQKMVNCHSWGNGLESQTDNSGFNIKAGRNMLSSCEAETNLGDGITIRGSVYHNAIVGSSFWGNGNKGIYIFGGSTNNSVTGNDFRNNGVNNTGQTITGVYSHVQVDSSNYNVVVGNAFDDDASALTVQTYAFTPTYSYPGRSAGTRTSAFCYTEINGANGNVVVGNSMEAARTLSGQATVAAGAAGVFAANSTGQSGLPSVASQATVTLPANADVVQITGTTTITAITAAARGRRVTLVFQSAGTTVAAGNNLAIGSNYVSTAGSTLTLICDGASWFRS